MIFTAQTVLSNVLIASLIGVLAWMVGRSGRRAGLAHLLWVAFFIKLVTPPLLLLPILPTHSRWLPGFDWWIGLGSVWLAGFAFFVARGMVRSIRFHLLLKRQGIPDPESAEFVASLLAGTDSISRFDVGNRCISVEPGRASKRLTLFTKLRLNQQPPKGPEVMRLPLRLSPMLFGFSLRPIIVCPEPLWDVLSRVERNAFLAHETAHFYRRDHWVRWLEWLVGCIYWWFPGVHLAHYQLERHEEACCDAWAVARLDSTPRQYIEALLRVVDFLSEHAIGIPRLANGMRPTDSLEERIRLLMCARGLQSTAAPLNLIAGIGCIGLMLVHPAARPVRTAIADSAWVQDVPTDVMGTSITSATLPPPVADRLPKLLPEPPVGFWNQPPPRRWANFALSLPGARLVADVDQGIRINSENYPPITFSSAEVSAIVEIPTTRRVVIGAESGTLRLWDLTAGMPVSFIGQHSSGVTSIAYHAIGGLVSGDQSGVVNRWDLQSGQILTRWSDPAQSIQSIRYADNGETMMILTGGWRRCGHGQEAHLVNSRSLQTIRSWPVHCAAAVVMDRPPNGWVVIDWSGNVRQLETDVLADTLSKNDVSSLVLSQDTRSTAEDVQ